MEWKPGEHVLASGPLTKWEIADVTGVPVEWIEQYLWEQEELGIVERSEEGWKLVENRARLVIRAFEPQRGC